MAKKKIEPRCYELADLEGLYHHELIEMLMDENVIKDRLDLAAMTEISNLRHEIHHLESRIERCAERAAIYWNDAELQRKHSIEDYVKM